MIRDSNNAKIFLFHIRLVENFIPLFIPFCSLDYSSCLSQQSKKELIFPHLINSFCACSTKRLEFSFISNFTFLFSRLLRRKKKKLPFVLHLFSLVWSDGNFLKFTNFVRGQLNEENFQKIYDRSFFSDKGENRNFFNNPYFSTQLFEFELHNGNPSCKIMIVLEAFFIIFMRLKKSGRLEKKVAKVFSLSKYFSFVGWWLQKRASSLLKITSILMLFCLSLRNFVRFSFFWKKFMFEHKLREKRNEKLNVCCRGLKVIDIVYFTLREYDFQQMSEGEHFSTCQKLIYLFKYPIRCSLWNQWIETEIGIINKRKIIHFRSKCFSLFHSIEMNASEIKWMCYQALISAQHEIKRYRWSRG